MHYLNKLTEIEARYEALTEQLGKPSVLSDNAVYQKTAKATRTSREMVEKFREWKDHEKSLAETKALVEDSSTDPEFKAIATEELATWKGAAKKSSRN